MELTLLQLPFITHLNSLIKGAKPVDLTAGAPTAELPMQAFNIAVTDTSPAPLLLKMFVSHVASRWNMAGYGEK
jgi:hypothetical protein